MVASSTYKPIMGGKATSTSNAARSIPDGKYIVCVGGTTQFEVNPTIKFIIVDTSVKAAELTSRMPCERATQRVREHTIGESIPKDKINESFSRWYFLRAV